MGIKLNVNDDGITVDADISGALFAAAKAVEKNAKSLCPVDTGTLKNSISVSSDDSCAQVFAGADYAAYVEFGTHKAAAQPFLVPALLMSETTEAFWRGLYD